MRFQLFLLRSSKLKIITSALATVFLLSLIATSATSEDTIEEQITNLEEEKAELEGKVSQIKERINEIDQKLKGLKAKGKSKNEQAKPLPNGITIEGLSIAPTWIEKMDNKVKLQLTLRKINTRKISKNYFEAEFIDDHQNTYRSETKVTLNLGKVWVAESYVYKAPVGFTWTSPILSFKVPSVAPLTKLKIYYVRGHPQGAWSEKIELVALDLSTLKPVETKDFYSEIKDEHFLSLPYKMEFKYLSAIIQKMKKRKDKYGNEHLIIPITVTNDDYNSTGFGLAGLGLQKANGDVYWGHYTGGEKPEIPTDGSFRASIPALSQKTIELEVGGSPKAVLFERLPGKPSDSFIILKVAPENFE